MSNYFHPVNDLPIFTNLEQEINDLLESGMVDWTSNQICINAPEKYADDYTFGCGSLHYDWKNVVRDNHGNIIHLPEYEHKYFDEDFNTMCRSFIGTAFEEIYNLLNSKFNLGRLRIMKSMPGTCLTWHKDISSRLHFPIKTSESCMMVIEDEVFHIPQNEWWMTDTLQLHTAFNGSREERIHLVGVIL